MGLALDHRGNLQAADVTGFKRRLIEIASPLVSALLTDPDHLPLGAPVGLLAPLEVTDYSLPPERRGLQMIDGWSVAQAKRCGLDGVKLLLPYFAESGPVLRERVAQVVAECAAADLPLWLEPIVHQGDPLEAVDSFGQLGVDVLKLECPSTTACLALGRACRVPWVALSGGVPFPAFLELAQAACEAGASGVMAGRSVWADSVERFDPERIVGRLQALAAVCERYGRPWGGELRLAPGWYRDY